MKKVLLKDKSMTIIFDTKKQSFEKVCENDFLKDLEVVCVREGNVVYVGVFDNKKSTLVHELFHCIDFINKRVNEFPESCFSESNAYLIEYLFKSFEKDLK